MLKKNYAVKRIVNAENALVTEVKSQVSRNPTDLGFKYVCNSDRD
jgi:hypothetical protein